MASERTAWGIEIGQCALKAIRLRYDAAKDTVEAVAFDFIEHSKILSQPDADPDALSREALQTFLSRNTVKGDKVTIGVPGQSGLARFIKLPPVESSRVPEIVKYEARQQIPFALEEVVWDFQRIGQAEETEGFALETEIGLFAMKRDLIYRYLNPFREALIEVDSVQMRPLAVYNFGAFDQVRPADAAEDGEEKKEEEDALGYKREELVEGTKAVAKEEGGFVVLLDIGADNSDLVITDGTRIWQRNLPIGGNHFTRALTKELKLTFAKAEHLKRNATKAQDPRAVFQAMRPVFNDLVSEIQRSIGFFASVHRQAKVTKIIGMGNAFKLPGLQKFLAQNLQYEVTKVESLTRLKGDAVLNAPAFQENVLSFTVAYGLALQGLGISPLRTNLLPPEISQARMIRRKKPWALSAAAILMFGFASLFFGSWSQLHAVNAPAFTPAEKAAKDAQDHASTNKAAFDKAKGEWEKVKNNGLMLTGNVEKRLEWMEVFAAINRALPRNPEDFDSKTAKEVRLEQSAELIIESIRVRWSEDVRKDWFEKVSGAPWVINSITPYDKAAPPSGPGWVFSLEGFHLNRAGASYTLRASINALDAFTAFSSPEVRQIGISCPVLANNVTDRFWYPNKDKRQSRGEERRSSAGFGGGGGGGGGGGSRMQAEGMGGASGGGVSGGGVSGGGAGGGGAGAVGAALGGIDPGGGQPDSSSGRGSDRRGRMGGMDSGSDDFAPRQEQPKAGDSGPKIKLLMKTDFTIEFVWQPIEKSKRKPLPEIEAALQKAGFRTSRPPQALLDALPTAPPAKSSGPGDQTKGAEEKRQAPMSPSGPAAPQLPTGGAPPGGPPAGASPPAGPAPSSAQPTGPGAP